MREPILLVPLSETERTESVEPAAKLAGGYLGEDLGETESGRPIEVAERAVSAPERAKLADKGAALPDGSYPIDNVSMLRDAIQAYGRASDKAAAKRHIIKRARALGATDLLPDDWKEAMSEADAELEEVSLAEDAELPPGTEIDIEFLEAGDEVTFVLFSEAQITGWLMPSSDDDAFTLYLPVGREIKIASEKVAKAQVPTPLHERMAEARRSDDDHFHGAWKSGSGGAGGAAAKSAQSSAKRTATRANKKATETPRTSGLPLKVDAYIRRQEAKAQKLADQANGLLERANTESSKLWTERQRLLDKATEQEMAAVKQAYQMTDQAQIAKTLKSVNTSQLRRQADKLLDRANATTQRLHRRRQELLDKASEIRMDAFSTASKMMDDMREAVLAEARRGDDDEFIPWKNAGKGGGRGGPQTASQRAGLAKAEAKKGAGLADKAVGALSDAEAAIKSGNREKALSALQTAESHLRDAGPAGAAARAALQKTKPYVVDDFEPAAAQRALARVKPEIDRMKAEPTLAEAPYRMGAKNAAPVQPKTRLTHDPPTEGQVQKRHENAGFKKEQAVAAAVKNPAKATDQGLHEARRRFEYQERQLSDKLLSMKTTDPGYDSIDRQLTQIEATIRKLADEEFARSEKKRGPSPTRMNMRDLD